MNIKVWMISGASIIALLIGGILFVKFMLLGMIQNNSNNVEEKTEALSYSTGSGDSNSSTTHVIIGSSVIVSLIMLLAIIAFRCEAIREKLQ